MAIKEGFQALVTQNRIDFRRVAPVRARVADEHVVGIVRHVGPVPTNPVGASLLAETHASYPGNCEHSARLRMYLQLRKTSSAAPTPAREHDPGPYPVAYSRGLSTRSAPASSRAWHGRAGTRRVLPRSTTVPAGNGWSYLKR